MDKIAINREQANKLHSTCHKCIHFTECVPSRTNKIWLNCPIAKDLLDIGKAYSELVDEERLIRKQKLGINVFTRSEWKEFAIQNGVKANTFESRVMAGYSYEDASHLNLPKDKAKKPGRRSGVFSEDELRQLKDAGIPYLKAYYQFKRRKSTFEKILEKGAKKKK